MNTLENQIVIFKRMKKILMILNVCLMALFLSLNAAAQEKSKVIRIAKLQIDSTQLEAYKTALKEEIEASVRVEPGVLTLYAVSDKDNPTQITIFEIYLNVEAYNSHRESPHFKKYKSITKEMVKSLDLTEAVPIIMETKAK